MRCKSVKYILICSVILPSILFADGTFRIVSDTTNKIYTSLIWQTATEIVSVYGNEWVRANSRRDWLPYPWSQLYSLDDIRWIGIHPTGRDCDWLGTFPIRSITFCIPSSDIAKANIWIASDDTVWFRICQSGDDVCFRESNWHQNGFVEKAFKRIDITEPLRDYHYDNGLYFDLNLTNRYHEFMGIIYYISIDFGQLKGIKYFSIDSGWNVLSLPLYTCSDSGSGYTIRELFPFTGADSVWVSFGTEYHAFGVDDTLLGAIGDTLRTYSFWFYSRESVASYTIRGIPIFEHRYLNDTGGIRFPGTVFDEDSISNITHEDPPNSITHWAYFENETGRWINAYYLMPGVGYRAIFTVVDENPSDRDTVVANLTLRGNPERIPDQYVQRDLGFIGREVSSSQLPLPPPFEPTGIMETDKQDRIFTIAPNPFNSSTVIEYKNTDELPLTLSIYDITGRKVKELTDNNTTPTFRYNWDGTDKNNNTLPSGIYLIHLSNPYYKKTYSIAFIK